MPISYNSSLLPFGNQRGSTDLCPAMQQCALNIYRKAWADYRAVGCPYGTTDEAMLVWYSFQSDSERPTLLTGKN